MKSMLTAILLVILISSCDSKDRDSEGDANSLRRDGLVDERPSDVVQSKNDVAERLVKRAGEILVSENSSVDKLTLAIADIESHLKAIDGLGVEKSELKEAELLASLGSLYAKKASFFSNDILKSGALVSTGFRHLDRSVARYPENITARMNRAVTSLKAPAFLNRIGIAKSDLEYLKSREDFSEWSPDLQSSIETYLSEVYERTGT